MSADPSRSTLQLLASRRFGPLFLTQFCGAFNDNVFKNALVLLIAFHGGPVFGLAPALAVQLAAGLFVLPFFLFSALAGQLADKYEKTRLIRLIKLAEIAIALIAAIGFATHHAELLLLALFLMGLHSTFFGPLKYSILPQHLHAEELVAGNAWVESGTFIAILAGTVGSGLLMAIKPSGPLLAGALCVAVALAGYWACRAIPPAPAPAPELPINHNFLGETWHNLRMAYRNRTVFHSTMGLSWFWFYGALLLTQFAPYVQTSLGGDELLVTALLATFIVGIALGSFLCERLSGKHVEPGLVPLGAIGLSLFGIDLWAASPLAASGTMSVGAFFGQAANWRIVFDLVMIGVAGGFFTVPLYALIQSRSAPAERSRIIAANNILNAAFMVASALFGGLMLQAGASIPQIFLVTALMNIAVAVYVFGLVPEFTVRGLAWVLTYGCYRVRQQGLEHVPAQGPALLVCNHVSFADAVILTALVRRPLRFVIDQEINRTPLLNWLFRASGAIPVASAHADPHSVQRAYAAIGAALDAGELVAIFPEGTITRDGEIGPFKGGLNKILRRNPVPVLPLALRGLWGSFFSRKHGRAMRRPFTRGIFNRVELVAGQPLTPQGLTPAALRQKVIELRGEWR